MHRFDCLGTFLIEKTFNKESFVKETIQKMKQQRIAKKIFKNKRYSTKNFLKEKNLLNVFKEYNFEKRMKQKECFQKI